MCVCVCVCVCVCWCVCVCVCCVYVYRIFSVAVPLNTGCALLHSHGTRCAGEVSAARDNGVCGVGIAYNSRVAGQCLTALAPLLFVSYVQVSPSVFGVQFCPLLASLCNWVVLDL